MFYKKIFSLIFLLLISLSCSDNDKDTVKKDIDTVTNSVKKDLDTLKNKLLPGDTLFNAVTVKEVVVDTSISDVLHDNLEDLFAGYIEIKEELADNDSIDTKKHAIEMLEIVSKSAGETGKKLDKNWDIEGSKIMKYQKIIESTNTLEEQREWFSKLTASLTEAIQKYGIPGKTIYELESPVTSGGKSSKWLTDSKDSDNPYTGNDDNDDNKVSVVRGWEFEKK